MRATWTPKSWALYCLYSLFWDIGPLFWALLEVQVDIVGHIGSILGFGFSLVLRP